MKNFILMTIPALFFFLLFSIKSTSVAPTAVDLSEVLRKSDFYRGGQVPGVSWNLAVENIEDNQLKNKLNLLVEASSSDKQQFALISFLAPKKYRSQRLLVRGNNMWFYKKALRQPVPISGRQRLTGSAANADVASTNYYQDYKITSSEEGEFEGEACWVLDLEATNKLVNYSHIRYWISKETNFGLKSDFYGKSKRKIKTAIYEYNNQVKYKKEEHPFISKISIDNKINPSNKTILKISEPRFEQFNNSKFQKNSLMR